MRAEHINPFITSLVNTFATMLDCEARRGPLAISSHGGRTYPVSGVIGLSGRAVGIVVINLSEEVALRAASAMLMMNITEMCEDVIDAVGELANVVAGQAKAELEEYNLCVSLPTVITGPKHEVHFPSDTKPISVPFDTDFGPMQMDVGLEPIQEPVYV